MSSLDLSAYRGHWVALFQEQVVGFGVSPDDALALARRNRPKDRFTLRFVEQEEGTLLDIPPLLLKLRPFFLKQSQPIYLVGGAIRDMMLDRPIHDLDFIVPHGAIDLSYQVGNKFGWPVYPLDKERDIGRVVLDKQNSTLDFAKFRGANLEEDLQDRDFTINAMALAATAQFRESIIDPTNGLEAIKKKRIELVQWESPNSLERDPVRALRAIRHSETLGFIMPNILQLSRQVSLEQVSPERIRDELLKVLWVDSLYNAVSHLYFSGLLKQIVPESETRLDKAIFSHALAAKPSLHHLSYFERLEKLLLGQAIEHELLQEKVVEILGKFQPNLQQYWQREVDGGINGRLLLRLALFFHKAGLPLADDILDDDGSLLINNPKAAAEAVKNKMRHFAFSNQAIERVGQIVSHQNRFASFEPETVLSRRDIYRYFRDCQLAGLDVCMLTLANQLEMSDGKITAKFLAMLNYVKTLFSAYFERYDEVIDPPLLVNGRDLMQQLNLTPGPEIGRLLRLIKEEQAAGTLDTKEKALAFARQASN